MSLATFSPQSQSKCFLSIISSLEIYRHQCGVSYHKNNLILLNFPFKTLSNQKSLVGLSKHTNSIKNFLFYSCRSTVLVLYFILFFFSKCIFNFAFSFISLFFFIFLFLHYIFLHCKAVSFLDPLF